MIKRLAHRLFRGYCRPEYYDEIVGDLEEMYQRNLPEGRRRAQWKYLLQVLGLVRLSIIRSPVVNSKPLMIRYYLKLALRAIRFNPAFSSINIIGLGLGLAACTLIFEYLSHEWSYDTFHSGYERIYRVRQDTYQEGVRLTESATTFSAVASELKQNYPAVEAACRIHRAGDNVTVRIGDAYFREEQVVGTDESFFEVFDFPFIYGAAETALTTPRGVVLTASVARKYFGTADPLGKEIIMNGAYGFWSESGYQDQTTLVVAGVIEDLPDNTHLRFELLVSFGLYSNLENELSNWGDTFYTYFRLSDPAALGTIASGLSAIAEQFRPEQGVKLGWQKMQEIHLTSNLVDELRDNGSEEVTWLLAGVAVLILIVAGTNYINFSTAKAVDRQKELAIRKIYWADTPQLLRQLLAEAVVLNGLALILALVLILLARPLIFDLLRFDLLARLAEPRFWMLVGAVTLGGTLISGLYPAFRIARQVPQLIAPRRVSGLFSRAYARKFLVIVQFTVSMLVIGCAVVLYRQMDFMSSKDRGIRLDKVLVVNGPTVDTGADSVYTARLESFRGEAQQLGSVAEVTVANFVPGKAIRGEAQGYVRRVGDDESDAGTYYFTQIDYGFIPEFEIPVVAGRAFDRAQTTDQQAVVINQAAARQLGFPSAEAAVGERINYRMNSTPTIIGVVANFHQYSLQQNFQPIIFEVQSAPQSYYYLKLSRDIESADLWQLKSLWQDLFPANPFSYFFLDDFYAQQYVRDRQFTRTFGVFASLAVLVATLGFLGLTYYTAVKRTREIGIRKTLGARLVDITLLLGRGVLVFILVAGLVSSPLIYYASERWLLNYAFRIRIEWWMMAAPVGLLLLTTGLVIVWQSIKTYRLDPVETLRAE